MNVNCPHCDKETPGGRVLCAHCGQKIHTAAPKSASSRAASGFMSFLGKLIRGLIRLTITVVLIGLIALTLWPVTPAGSEGAAAEGERITLAMKQISNAKLSHTKLRETELNSYLASQLEASGGSDSAVAIEQLNLDVLPEHIVFITATTVGPVRLTWELTLAPSADETSFPLDVQKARLGHLPLIGPLKDIAGNKIVGLFSEFNEEQEILESVKQIKLADGEVLLIN